MEFAIGCSLAYRVHAPAALAFNDGVNRGGVRLGRRPDLSLQAPP